MKIPRKKKMPEHPPTIAIESPIKLILMHDFDRFENGLLVMRIADTDLRVLNGKKEIGSMGTAMGGTMYFSHGSRLWKFDASQLWDAAVEAERTQYLQTIPKPKRAK